MTCVAHLSFLSNGGGHTLRAGPESAFHSAASALLASLIDCPAKSPDAHRDLQNSEYVVTGRLGWRSSWMALRLPADRRWRRARALFASATSSAVWLSTQALYVALLASLLRWAVSWSRCGRRR